MKSEPKNKKRKVGRPPTGKVLVGFKLSPELVKTIRRVAKQTGRQQSELVEEALWNWLH
jgi:Ribbon-helix-helix protein, copG family